MGNLFFRLAKKGLTVAIILIFLFFLEYLPQHPQLFSWKPAREGGIIKCDQDILDCWRGVYSPLMTNKVLVHVVLKYHLLI